MFVSSSSSPLVLFSNSNLLRPQAFAYKVFSQIGDSFAFQSSSKSAHGRGSLWLARAQCRCSKEGLIDHNILAALFVPPPREASTSAQAADQGDEIEGDDRSTKDLT
ncbi:hypothetical protein KY285_033286 [Solanum tuberosum]|nr:hypothetical protein KY285_033286 [Solanum tuberosum]